MNRKYLAFDIETAKTTEDGTDWRSCRPLGISCAATLLADSNERRLWHGGADRNSPADRMSPQDAKELVEYLATQVENGYTIVTWNGLGFDFDILAEESEMLENCRKLATNHVNMMFHILCELGYAVGLDAAAKGMGLAGKSKGMSGELAPVLWAEGGKKFWATSPGRKDDDGVGDDLRSLRAMRWYARSGKLRSMALPKGWLTVEAAGKVPEPDTSWISDPLSRKTFTEWLG